MQSRDAHLKELVMNGIITWEEAVAHATDPEELRRLAGAPKL